MVDNTKISLGTRILSGLSLHLLLDVKIERTNSGYIFTLMVPVCGYHPRSDLFTSPIVSEMGLFKAVIETTNNSRSYCEAQNRLGFTTSLCLYIRSMWIVSKCINVEVTAEERSMLLGLERKVFYVGLQYIIDKYKINIDDTMIMYDINETCSVEDSKVFNYMQLDYETLVEYYRNICPNKSPKRLTTTLEELARRIVCYEKGRKMQLYLSTILGMKRVAEDIMATLLSIFLEKCMIAER